MLILGIILSVIIYYIFYFFSLLGSNNQIPTIAAIWFPNLILFLCCMVGIVNIIEINFITSLLHGSFYYSFAIVCCQ